MQTVAVTLDRAKARELYRAYKAHQHYSEPIDRELQRAYQLLAQGRLVIQALESVRAAGLNDQGLPKLAICRADQQSCRFRRYGDGNAVFTAHPYGPGWAKQERDRLSIFMPAGSFPSTPRHVEGLARLPLIPLHLRPRRGIANYHVLWEAEWNPVPPRDPYLLRRIGKADLWLVVAMWDLTEVERAALATRMNG